MPRRRRLLQDSAGFTFVELIVGLAIMVMIASVVSPVLFSSLDRARIDTAKGTLQGFSDAIDEFEQDVKEHPGTLTQLGTQISSSQLNLCDISYKVGQGKGGDATWNGPYLSRELPDNGYVPVGIGRAVNDLTRVGDKTREGLLVVTIVDATPEDAVLLDSQLDGGDGDDGGTIRWQVLANGTATVQYVKPSPRC